MENNKVWGVSDNGFIRLYSSEKKAREEYLALVESIKENKYFHPSTNRKTKVEHEVDDYDTHYIIYSSFNIITGADEYRQAWYQQMEIH